MSAISTWWSDWHGQRVPVPAEDERELDACDVAELEGVFAAVEVQHRQAWVERIVLLLHPLIDRRVPVRAVEAAPGLRAARVRFADGTAVLARGRVPGDVGILARWVGCRTVVPVMCSLREGDCQIEFSIDGLSNRITVRVTGFDQPA